MQDADRVYPRLGDDAELVRHRTWAVVASGHGRHLRLTLDEAAFVGNLDGRSARAEILHGAPPWAGELLDELLDEGFLTASLIEAPARFVLTRNGFEVDGAQTLVERAHKVLAPLWNSPVQLLAALLAAAGPVALLYAILDGRPLASNQLHPLIAVLALLGLEFIVTVLHELSHALVLVHYGRRFGRVGVGFYWGALSFFVDASDALLLSRKQRLQQGAAGVAGELVVGGLLALVAIALGPGVASGILLQFVLLSWINIAMNLVPLLELDGYWLLSDALDEPQLRRRSLAAVRNFNSDRKLATYGVCSVVFGSALFAVSIATWWAMVHTLFSRLLDGSTLEHLAALLLALPVAIAIVSLVVQTAVVAAGKK